MYVPVLRGDIVITIDGIEYNAEWVTNTLEQTADVINGDNSGRLQGNKSMFLDYVGTFFNHTGQIRRGRSCTDAEWDKLYLTLANPINDHTIILPFGQGNITIKIYISQVKRKLIKVMEERSVWSKVYDVTLTAMDAQWLAGGKIKG